MSRAQLILQIVELTKKADIAALSELLLKTNALRPEHIFRILLTYLPEGTEPGLYVGLLQQITFAKAIPRSENAYSSGDAIVVPISEDEAKQRVRKLRLLPLADPRYPLDQESDPLTLFLLYQAHKIDSDTGSLDVIRRLLEPFVNHSEVLRTWMVSKLLPLLRLEYDYYLRPYPALTLGEFERMEGRGVIERLLIGHADDKSKDKGTDTARDLKGLVGPWMYGEYARKRQKLNHEADKIVPTGASKDDRDVSRGGEWSYVNDWILGLSLQDFPRTEDVLVRWDGPGDADYGEWGEEMLPIDPYHLSEETGQYARTRLAVFYAVPINSTQASVSARKLLEHIRKLAALPKLSIMRPASEPVTKDYMDSISQAHLMYNALLRRDNPLTQSSPIAIAFLSIVFSSSVQLQDLDSRKPCKDVVELMLFSTEEDQKIELQRIVQRLKGSNPRDEAWATVRQQLLWLRCWEVGSDEGPAESKGVFGKVSAGDLELVLLRAMLDAGCYRVPYEIYCEKDAPLPPGIVKEAVLDAALSTYDAASNGNRTRGGAKKASDIFTTFKNQFPDSQRFTQIGALLAATHSMSFYSLTLQQGVPFQPVNIRAHKDPISLIGKILDQNPRSYTHLDDMIDIGQNLVAAGLGRADGRIDAIAEDEMDIGQEKLIVRRRVTRMAIEAALAEDDFDTAYSYVVNRLYIEAKNEPRSSEPRAIYDDISWRAAYAAGRYPASNFGASALRRIEQRMELLSQALLLAPPSALAELLSVWQRCEENLNELLAQEAAEEKEAEKYQRQHIPGGFSGDSSPPKQKGRDLTRGAMQEDAPMGLFDAAREVGAALGKSAFPLRGAGKAPLQEGEREEEHESEDSEGAARVRKRDMVSKMVTGGLASGIGWVIGAPPVKD